MPPSQSISLTVSISGLLFIGLNIADAWLTGQLLALGWQEINPIVKPYGPNLVIRGLLAVAIVVALVRFGKAKLLWVLNIAMSVVVLWLGVGLLNSL